MIRTVGENLLNQKPRYDKQRIMKIKQDSEKVIHKELLHKFIQAVLVVITRKRANRRLMKLKWLIYEMKMPKDRRSIKNQTHSPRRSVTVEVIKAKSMEGSKKTSAGSAILHLVEEVRLKQQQEAEDKKNEMKATTNRVVLKKSKKAVSTKSSSRTPKAAENSVKHGVEHSSQQYDNGRGESNEKAQNVNDEPGRSLNLHLANRTQNRSGGDSSY